MLVVVWVSKSGPCFQVIVNNGRFSVEAINVEIASRLTIKAGKIIIHRLISRQEGGEDAILIETLQVHNGCASRYVNT